VPAAHPTRYLLRARDLVDARYAEPLDLGVLAREAGLSRAHFSAEFRRAFGEDFRWLAVSPPGQPDIAIVLTAIPGAPVMDSATADDVRALMSKGYAGTVFLTTDDCRRSYEELRARRVEFTEEPEEGRGLGPRPTPN
jgi:AraC-like DNA-binding protein